ncbi:hypothetical protein BCR44DRAFT_1429137, partial [Catenaria anguillulae PL171]
TGARTGARTEATTAASTIMAFGSAGAGWAKPAWKRAARCMIFYGQATGLIQLGDMTVTARTAGRRQWQGRTRPCLWA